MHINKIKSFLHCRCSSTSSGVDLSSPVHVPGQFFSVHFENIEKTVHNSSVVEWTFFASCPCAHLCWNHFDNRIFFMIFRSTYYSSSTPLWPLSLVSRSFSDSSYYHLPCACHPPFLHVLVRSLHATRFSFSNLSFNLGCQTKCGVSLWKCMHWKCSMLLHCASTSESVIVLWLQVSDLVWACPRQSLLMTLQCVSWLYQTSIQWCISSTSLAFQHVKGVMVTYMVPWSKLGTSTIMSLFLFTIQVLFWWCFPQTKAKHRISHVQAPFSFHL